MRSVGIRGARKDAASVCGGSGPDATGGRDDGTDGATDQRTGLSESGSGVKIPEAQQLLLL